MSRQLTFSDVAAQRTLPDASAPTADTDGDDDDNDGTTPTTRADLLDRARQYAATVAAKHFPEFLVERIEWGISERVHRTAGRTKHDPEMDEGMIPWRYFAV